MLCAQVRSIQIMFHILYFHFFKEYDWEWCFAPFTCRPTYRATWNCPSSSSSCGSFSAKCPCKDGYKTPNSCTPCTDSTRFCKNNGNEYSVQTGHYAVVNPQGVNVAQQVCTAGFYCFNGVRTACTAPTYQDEQSATSCKTVQDGHYLLQSNSGLLIGQQACEAGYRCNSGVRAACVAPQYQVSKKKMNETLFLFLN